MLTTWTDSAYEACEKDAAGIIAGAALIVFDDRPGNVGRLHANDSLLRKETKKGGKCQKKRQKRDIFDMKLKKNVPFRVGGT